MNKREKEYREALDKIAAMGVGVKQQMIDWSNIGKNAVYTATEALKEKCSKCGK